MYTAVSYGFIFCFMYLIIFGLRAHRICIFETGSKAGCELYLLPNATAASWLIYIFYCVFIPLSDINLSHDFRWLVLIVTPYFHIQYHFSASFHLSKPSPSVYVLCHRWRQSLMGPGHGACWCETQIINSTQTSFKTCFGYTNFTLKLGFPIRIIVYNII